VHKQKREQIEAEAGRVCKVAVNELTQIRSDQIKAAFFFCLEERSKGSIKRKREIRGVFLRSKWRLHLHRVGKGAVAWGLLDLALVALVLVVAVATTRMESLLDPEA
jgi:hypothetical protein